LVRIIYFDDERNSLVETLKVLLLRLLQTSMISSHIIEQETDVSNYGEGTNGWMGLQTF
jgi:hypothetical protein